MPDTALIFDVNETLLDLKSLDPHFDRAFGDAAVRPQWFGLMLQLSFGGIATGRYLDFPSAQRSALRMLAERRGVELEQATIEQIVEQMNHLSPHQEVKGALSRLRDAGFKMATLTNSPEDVALAQLKNAGLHELFDSVLSADKVKRLKPAPEPYRHAAEQMGVPIPQSRLIAAHWWDVDGALAAGCRAAFVRRPGTSLNPATPRPDIVEDDLALTAAEILRLDG